MKVICRRTALLEALDIPGQIATRRTPKPVLACVKLVAADHRLSVTATDLETTVTTTDLNVEVEEDGVALVPAERFVALVSATTDDTLTLETTSGRDLRVVVDDGTFVIPSPDERAGEFPATAAPTEDYDFSLPGMELKRLINQTAFCAARESTRYAFNGVLVVAKGKKVSMASTDGRRLAVSGGDLMTVAAPKSKHVMAPPTDPKPFIVPAPALRLLEKLIDQNDEPSGLVFVKVHDGAEAKANFSWSGTSITSNLVEGQFPPYDDVIPKDTDKKMTADVADFLDAIRRTEIFGDAPGHPHVRLSFSKTGLRLTAGRLREYGTADIEFHCQFEGGDYEMGFNGQFVLDALLACASDTFTLEMKAPNRPGLLRDGGNFLCVIVPVNLD